jgi:hypothetical protein
MPFTVYEDFFNCQSCAWLQLPGGVAAIKDLGWGAENGLSYWLCANSWGMSGFFKIKQGDSGTYVQMFGCAPQVDATPL